MQLNTKVRLPILKSMEILDYPMYPGSEGHGFRHTFQPGLNVVVGVNGLGKTTLLNVLFRTLVGPFEPRKADLQEPGAKLHELTELKRFNYFAARIGADARAARVRLELAFDKDLVTIVRNLGPSLEVLDLRHNKRILNKPDEQRYLDLVREVSGIESAYDWDFVVRNLLFFFEEKVPLIWNPKGQFEILRILFLDTELSSKCAALHDDIMGEDSQTRNLAWHIDRLETQMSERLAALQMSSEDVESLADLQRTQNDVNAEVALMEGAERDLQKRLQDLEHEIFTGNMEIYEQGSALEHTRLEYLKNAFPHIPDVTQVVFGKLFSDEHCMLCSNPSINGRERLRKLLRSQRCPVCESRLVEGNKITAPKHLSDVRLRTLEQNQRTREKVLEQLEARKAASQNELLELQKTLNGKLVDRAKISQRIERALALSGESVGVSQEQEIIQAQKRELDTRRSKLVAKRRRYDSLLTKARERIGEIAKEIVSTFGTFSQSFILEECKLTFQMDPRPVGQSGIRINFPSFELEMTSAVLPIPRPRHEAEQVSESQKEFIDLAFRMALLDAANQGRGSLLVIETPEASLDSVFVDRAGSMLHRFAHGRGNKNNQIIATSNLNKENMIPALLGLKDERGKVKRANSETRKRVINLLELAAPSRAYLEFKGEYDKTFREALGG